jgi:hypothetical protein
MTKAAEPCTYSHCVHVVARGGEPLELQPLTVPLFSYADLLFNLAVLWVVLPLRKPNKKTDSVQAVEDLQH